MLFPQESIWTMGEGLGLGIEQEGHLQIIASATQKLRRVCEILSRTAIKCTTTTPGNTGSKN